MISPAVRRARARSRPQRTLIRCALPGLTAPARSGRAHHVVRTLDVDRDDRDAVLGGEDGGAGAHAVQAAVARARALRVQQQVPALAQDRVEVLGRAALQAAALALDRHRVEDQRDDRRDQLVLVEVVGGRTHRGALAPLARQRAHDDRRVDVAGDRHEQHQRLQAVRRPRRLTVGAQSPVDDQPRMKLMKPWHSAAQAHARPRTSRFATARLMSRPALTSSRTAPWAILSRALTAALACGVTGARGLLQGRGARLGALGQRGLARGETPMTRGLARCGGTLGQSLAIAVAGAQVGVGVALLGRQHASITPHYVTGFTHPGWAASRCWVARGGVASSYE